MAKLLSWQELFPTGRYVFYDGNDPKSFVKEMKSKFKFDPSKNNPSWNKADGYYFFCPPEVINQVYGVPEYPLGS